MNRQENVLPPELGKIVAIAVDTTSRVYDLGALLLGGERVELGGTMALTMQTYDAPVFYAFSDSPGGTVDESAVVAAGGAPAFSAGACAVLGEWYEGTRFQWNRIRHRYLIVKSSGSTTLRLWVSSQKTSR